MWRRPGPRTREARGERPAAGSRWERAVGYREEIRLSSHAYKRIEAQRLRRVKEDCLLVYLHMSANNTRILFQAGAQVAYSGLGDRVMKLYCFDK